MKPIGEIMKNVTIPAPVSETKSPRTSEDADVCPICNGAGYVRIDAPVDSPNFSRLIQCTCRRRSASRSGTTNIDAFGNLGAVRDWTFDTFNPSVPGAKEAYEIASEYARDPYDWLVLYGNYGCGKTHLAAAIANYAQENLTSVDPVFAVVPDLLDYLRAAFAPSSETKYEARFESIRNAGLLVLDDLGTENTTPWAREKLFQIVNFRYMERLPTVFTTNVDPDRIEGRIRSRMFDAQLSQVVFIDADDFRLRNTRLPRRPRSKS